MKQFYETYRGDEFVSALLTQIRLKIGRFKPEHVGQINFYPEALDRDVKKPNENSSVGLILCANKDDAVVEYVLSRSLSPTLVSDYTLRLLNICLSLLHYRICKAFDSYQALYGRPCSTA